MAIRKEIRNSTAEFLIFQAEDRGTTSNIYSRRNWMRNRNTIEYLGVWETLYNPDFKPLEFEGFRRLEELALRFSSR